MLDKIAQAIKSLQNPIDCAEVNIFIAKQFNLIHQPDRALPYIEQALQEIALISIEEKFVINELKCKIAEQLAKVGLQNRSIAMLTEALQQADAFENPEDRDYALIAVSEAHAEIGMSDRAIQIGLMLDDDYKRVWRLFDSIAHIAIVQHSHHEQIFNILAVIDDSQDKDHFLLEVANTYFASNQPERAIALVPLMTYSSSKAEALAEAVKGRSETIARDQLLDLLNQAEAHAFLEQDVGMKAQALRMIAKQHIELKQFTHAHTLLEQAKQFAVSLSATHLLEQIPRDVILGGIARAFGKLAEHKAATQTTDAMTDKMLSASDLSVIAQKDSVREKPDGTLKTQTLQELSAAEDALAGDNSHLADLRRVMLAEAWSALKLFERVQSIAGQISDPNLKTLALRYAGIGVGESQCDRFERLSAACESATKQRDFDKGVKILIQLLEQIPSLDENYFRRSFVIRVVNAYFNLLGNL
ncbi:MAG: hypothetical protein KME13_11100 [Myxacorys californica WJT36-NPBG1]|nr:hypothetical protein [Myxacorys californica WJT36-NPBG1]